MLARIGAILHSSERSGRGSCRMRGLCVLAAGAILAVSGCARLDEPSRSKPGDRSGTSAPSATTRSASASGQGGASPSGGAVASEASNSPVAGGSPVGGGRGRVEGTAMDRQMAMFGAGCFWGVEAIFRKQDGVIDTAVGYAGGHTADPTYKDICTDQTGHAEVVRVEFDASVVSYETLVDLFFRLHDPTQLNRQGPDIGSQYRSVIFYYTEGQREIAQTVKARRESSGKHRRKIVTVIETAPTFYLAEDYHQQYFAKRGLENTCHVPSED